MYDNRIDSFDMDAALDAGVFERAYRRITRLVMGLNQHARATRTVVNLDAVNAATVRAQVTIDDPNREAREAGARIIATLKEQRYKERLAKQQAREARREERRKERRKAQEAKDLTVAARREARKVKHETAEAERIVLRLARDEDRASRALAKERPRSKRRRIGPLPLVPAR